MSPREEGEAMELETEHSERSVRVRPEEEAAGQGTTSRLVALSGMIGILILDLLALDDITTAGEWVPEFAFLAASLPALLFLGHMALKRPRSAQKLEEGRRARLERGAEVNGRDDREGVGAPPPGRPRDRRLGPWPGTRLAERVLYEGRGHDHHVGRQVRSGPD